MAREFVPWDSKENENHQESTYLRYKALSSYFIFWRHGCKLDPWFLNMKLFKLIKFEGKKNISMLVRDCKDYDEWGEKIQGGRSTIILTRPFLRLAWTHNFPLLKLCSIIETFSEFALWPSSGWTICSIVAFIEDMYSRAAVARFSCRSEWSSQNKLNTWSAAKKETTG